MKHPYIVLRSRKEYVDPALDTKNKLTLDEVTNIADEIQNANVDKIYSKYGDRLVTTISTGIHSLHIAKYVR